MNHPAIASLFAHLGIERTVLNLPSGPVHGFALRFDLQPVGGAARQPARVWIADSDWPAVLDALLQATADAGIAPLPSATGPRH
jgi:hypothetical protein